jgi:hypothetical protein
MEEREDVMNTRTKLVAFALALILISLVAAQRTFAQHTHDHASSKAWRTGMVELSGATWVGDVQLKRGIYHVKHVVEKDKHWLLFKSVLLPAGYRRGSMWEEKEITRLECRVEPTTKSVRSTKITFGRNASGERLIQEIQIGGEKFRHILIVPSAV